MCPFPFSYSFNVRRSFIDSLKRYAAVCMGRIYSEWFPSSNYQLAVGQEMLRNEHKDVSSPTFHSEIWVPVSAENE